MKLKRFIQFKLNENNIKFNINIPEDILMLNDLFKSFGKLYLVGGSVRDALMNKKIKDYDLVTDILPDKVEEILIKNNITVLDTGKKFGIIFAIINNEQYEIATFRRDLSGGRRPDAVEYTNMENDVNRRDLTINALYYDIDKKEIIDLVNGVSDIKNNIIRTVGSPIDRFNEDPLRVLRSIRFATRYNSELDSATDQALKVSTLDGISPERIRDEFIKGINSAQDKNKFIELINNYNFFKWIFNGLTISEIIINEFDDYITICAKLLKDNPILVLEKQLNKLTYTVSEVNKITYLVQIITIDDSNIVNLKRLNKKCQCTNEQILAMRNDSIVQAFVKFNLTVDGQDVMKSLGLTRPNKQVGEEINRLELENFKKLL